VRRSLWLLAGVLIAMHARADEPLELEWTAPPGCPTQDDVLAEVRRIVGSGEVRRKVHATANVSTENGRWSLALKTEDGGERTLEGHTCKAVASAAALVLALTLQTDPAPLPSVTASASVLPPPPPASSSAPPPPPPPPPTPKTRLSPIMRAGGGIAPSGVPGVAGVGMAELGARYGRFEGDLTFAFLSETFQDDGSGSDVGGQFAQVAVGALGCIAPLAAVGATSDKSQIDVWGCAGGEVEWMLARRVGPFHPGFPTEATYAYFAPVVSPRLTWSPLRRLAFVLESTFSFPLERQRFVLCRLPVDPNGACPMGGEVPIFRVPPAGLRVVLAVELRF
jgi:hypothetical protein